MPRLWRSTSKSGRRFLTVPYPAILIARHCRVLRQSSIDVYVGIFPKHGAT